jgi:hypothetical protein
MSLSSPYLANGYETTPSAPQRNQQPLAMSPHPSANPTGSGAPSPVAMSPSNGALRGPTAAGGSVGGISSAGSSSSAVASAQAQVQAAAAAAAGMAAAAAGGPNGAWQPTNVGEQMDMNVLWELVSNLAEVHQGIREQTQGVLQRVQMIQSRGLDGPRDAAGASPGGESPPPPFFKSREC